MTAGTRDSGKNGQGNHRPVWILAVLTLGCIAVSLYCLWTNTYIIFQNLFYFPIIIACVLYYKKGFAFSVLLSFLYFGLVFSGTHDTEILTQAGVRTGIFILVATIITALSERIRDQEQRLRETEEKYRLAMETTTDGLWDWDLKTGAIYYSPGFVKMTGGDGLEPSFHAWEERMHSEDREAALSSLRDHLSGHTGRWRHELRLQTPAGEWKWVLCRGSVTDRDENGSPIRMMGVIADISEQKEGELIIRTERDRASRYLTIAGVIIVALSRTGTVLLVNRRGSEVLGAPPEVICGMNWFETFIPSGQRDEVRKTFDAIIRGTEDLFSSHENEIITLQGEKRIIFWRNTLIRDQDGTITGTLSSGEDITGTKELEAEKKKLLDQIHQNMAQMAFLNDTIRNPLAVIMLLAETGYLPDTSRQIATQVAIINDAVTRLDQQWSESEKVLTFLRKHYQIAVPTEKSDAAE